MHRSALFSSGLILLFFASLSVFPLAAPAAAPSSGLAAVLQPFVDGGTLAGAVVLVADKEKALALEAVGWMDLAARKEMRSDCLFWIASQSKPITAAALMILVDEGKVGLDDPVEKYLPEFKNQWLTVEQDGEHVLLRKPKRPVTVRTLLSHTSGMPFKSAMEEPTLDRWPLEARVQSYAMTPLQSEPGTKYQYSNAGINTAGRIIEVASGTPCEMFLEERLFKPLGMRDTTFRPSARQLRRLAKAYRPGAAGLEECAIEQLRYPLDGRGREPMPAGGLFSTARDVSLFYRMIANGGVLEGRRVLSEDAVKQMTSKQTGHLPASYGLGLSVDGGRVGHGGAYGTHSGYDAQRGLITVFLVQHACWSGNGDRILPAFQKAAVETFRGDRRGSADHPEPAPR